MAMFGGRGPSLASPSYELPLHRGSAPLASVVLLLSTHKALEDVSTLLSSHEADISTRRCYVSEGGHRSACRCRGVGGTLQGQGGIGLVGGSLARVRLGRLQEGCRGASRMSKKMLTV